MSSQVEKKAKVADEQQQATTAEKEEEELIKREEREREAVDIHRERMAAISILSQLEKLAPEQPLETADIHGVADYVVKNNIKNIIVMCGAGISVSAGIPDFRSKGTGLYDNLEAFNLPEPEDLFTLSYLLENPKPFFVFSKFLFPGNYQPTKSHYFIKLLSDKGLLLRCYTQNIDTLESVAGIPHEKTVFSHGSFTSAHCVVCKAEQDLASVKRDIFADRIPRCTHCGTGIVKPDIVFFGESMPERFFELSEKDFPKCDLLIVMGTSLAVYPFAGLVSKVRPDVPRVLVNMEKVNARRDMHIDGISDAFVGSLLPEFGFDCSENRRDVFIQGKCDDGVQTLADELGMGDELREMAKDCILKDSSESLSVATKAIAASVKNLLGTGSDDSDENDGDFEHK